MAVVLPALIRPRSRQNTVVRAVRYLGLAAWMGGTLRRAVICDGAPGRPTAEERRWDRVVRIAIAGHLAGSAALGWAGRHRGPAQRGMPAAMLIDTAATVAGLAARAVATGRGTPMSLAEPLLAAGSIAAQGYMAEMQRPLPSLHRLRLLPTRGRPPGRHAAARAARDAALSVGFGAALHRSLTVPAADDQPSGRWLPGALAAATGIGLLGSANGAERQRPAAVVRSRGR